MKPPVDNRGSNGVARWLELQKAGGEAPSPQEVRRLLYSRRDKPLEREEIARLLEEFFQECITQEIDEETGAVLSVWKSAPTKNKLALKLGVSKSTLMNCVKGGYGLHHEKPYLGGKAQLIDEKDFDLIRMAYSVVESYYESLLSQNRNNAGTIFWMLNSDRSKWQNDSRLELSTEQHREDLPEMSAQEVAGRYADSALLPPTGEGGPQA